MTTHGFERQIAGRIEESRKVKAALLADDQVLLIASVAKLMVEAYRKARKVLIFGNGGSAADAQHMAAELVGKYYYDRPPLLALALHANTSSLTAIANDYSYDLVFARQVEAMAVAGDVAIGISTSGNSENVIQGVKTARAKGASSVGMTGESGGRLKQFADYCLCVPSHDTPRIQEAHMMVGHILCEIVELQIFPRTKRGGQEGHGVHDISRS